MQPVIALALALALLPMQEAEPAPATAPVVAVDGGVTLVRIEGELDAGTLALVSRALRETRARGGRQLVCELDTPGGSIEIMWQLAKTLHSAVDDGLAVATWVHPRALSAGVLVALSSDSVYMSPRATIGAAQPVVAGPTGIQAIPEEGGVREKLTSALRAQFRSCAEWGHRDPVLAEAMVDPALEVREAVIDGVRGIVSGREWDDARERGDAVEHLRTVCRQGELLSLSAEEAVELGFADGIAASLDEVLEAVGEARAQVHTVERSRSEDLLGRLDELGALLLLAGLLLAFLEFKVPGFGLPGILSIVCFALLLIGRWFVGLADVPHLVLAVAGVVLVGLELFLVPGTIWVGLLGAGMLIGGLILGSLGPGFSLSNPLDESLAFDVVFELTMAGLGALLGMWFLSRWLPKTPGLRWLTLLPGNVEPAFAGGVPEHSPERLEAARPGAIGRATSHLRPVGKVVIEGEPGVEYEARSSGVALDLGQRVRVIEAGAGRLVVEALAEDESRRGDADGGAT